MEHDDFVNAAFPDNLTTKLHGGKLLKYAQPPGLVVLIPAQRIALKAEVEIVFDRINADGFVAPLRSLIGIYESYSDLSKFIEKQGEDNIFIIVDEMPDDSLQLMPLKQALGRILRWPESVERLLARARASRGFVSRNRTAATGEIITTATIIHPRYSDPEIGLMIYIAYYFELSPSASSAGQQFFTRFFQGVPRQSVELTDFARRYFRVFADARVRFGVTKETFVACR